MRIDERITLKWAIRNALKVSGGKKIGKKEELTDELMKKSVMTPVLRTLRST